MDKITLGQGHIYFPTIKPRLDAYRSSVSKFTMICEDIDREIVSEWIGAYRRMYPGIRKRWLRDARRKMSKRAWRRLRGKVKAL